MDAARGAPDRGQQRTCRRKRRDQRRAAGGRAAGAPSASAGPPPRRRGRGAGQRTDRGRARNTEPGRTRRGRTACTGTRRIRPCRSSKSAPSRPPARTASANAAVAPLIEQRRTVQDEVAITPPLHAGGDINICSPAIHVHVRKPRALRTSRWHHPRHGTADLIGLDARLLPGADEPRCALQRAPVRRRRLDRDILPADLPGALRQVRELPLLSRARPPRRRPAFVPACAADRRRRLSSASWRGTSNTVSRGFALIADGALDGEGASVDELAERLGIGERQLRRLFEQHLGASPITVAQTQRVLFAKQLIHDTRLPMAEIALAAGFGSVRRFDETFQQLFRQPPSALRGARPCTLCPKARWARSASRCASPIGRRTIGTPCSRSWRGARSQASNGSRARPLPDRAGRIGLTGTLEISRLPEQGQPQQRPFAFRRVRALPAIRRAHPARVRSRRRCGGDRRASGAGPIAGAVDRRAARPARARWLGRIRARGARRPWATGDGGGRGASSARPSHADLRHRPAGRTTPTRAGATASPSPAAAQVAAADLFRARHAERTQGGVGRAGPGGAGRTRRCSSPKAPSRRPWRGCVRSAASVNGRPTTSPCGQGRWTDAVPASDIGLLRGAADRAWVRGPSPTMLRDRGGDLAAMAAPMRHGASGAAV